MGIVEKQNLVATVKLNKIINWAQKDIRKGARNIRIDEINLVPLSFLFKDVMLDINTIEGVIESMEGLFDRELGKYLGIDKPRSVAGWIDLYYQWVTNMQNGTKRYWIAYVAGAGIGTSDAVAIFYLYDINKKWHKANMSIGIHRNYRNTGVAFSITEGVIKWFTTIERFWRLGIEIETTNRVCLQFAENRLSKLGFVKEGVLHCNFGIDGDSEVWSYTINTTREKDFI